MQTRDGGVSLAFCILHFAFCLHLCPVPTLLAYYIHQLSPFIVQFNGRFGLHWYGFAYVLSFLVGYQLYRLLAARGYGEMPPETVADFITYAAVFGVMLGGRLGWVIFYGWGTVRANPLNAFKLWEGGMSSHGGILGLVVFTYVYARRHGYSWPGVGDNLVVVAPVGLFIVRLANFVNGELWGRVIDSPNPPPWAMRFPKEFEGTDAAALVERAYQHDPQALDILSRLLPLRHPSQIYEALLEGAVLFTTLWVVRTRFRAPVGMLTGIFLAGYAVLRIIGEQFREPDAGIGYQYGMTRGQLLSLFFILLGAVFIVYSLRTRRYQLPGMRPAVAAVPVKEAAAATRP